MAKLNIVTVLNQIVEETPNRAEMHPYYGLRDARGWMTRYVTAEEIKEDCLYTSLISAEWIQNYIKECKKLQIQPSFDAMGCYGPSPYFEWLENHSPKLIAKLVAVAHENRFDNVPHLGYMAEDGVVINPEITLEDLRILLSGYEKFRLLGFWRHPIMTLGRKSWYWVGQELAKHHIQDLAKHHEEVMSHLHILYYGDEEDFLIHNLGYRSEINKHPNIVNALFTKPQKRKRIKAMMNKRRSKNFYRRKKYSSIYFQLLAKYRSKADVMRVYRKSSNVECITVSYGEILYNQDTQTPILFLDYKEGMEVLRTKKYAGLNTVSLPKRYLVYRDCFLEHVEADKLRDAVNRFNSRYRVKGNTMSLRDVVNARHFCFRGTLRFLKDKMPHVARLIEPYAAWNQVPAEIMDIQWSLASRDIFDGYPRP